MAEFIPGSAFGSLSQMRMQPSPMMSPEQAAAYRTTMLQANATPTESPVTANFEGAYSTGPRGSQLMLNPSVSAKLGDALTVGGGYRTGPMGGVHGRAEIKLPAGLRALLEGSKAGQSAAVAAPVAGGELSATLARMAGQRNMPAQMQGRVGYRIPFANGGVANVKDLPPEQDESLIDMATRYGQGVMRKHPIITRGLASAATDPLDLMQFLAMHGVDPGIVAPNQIETPDQVAARQELASSIPNAGELAQKYLAKAGVRESETLPEQIGELGVSMLGPAVIAKAPKAFSWGKRILGKIDEAGMAGLPRMAGGAQRGAIDLGPKTPVGKSGLPIDEASRMKRAEEMGFDVSRVLYHSTPYKGKEKKGIEQAIEAFIPSKRGRIGPGVYFSPSSKYAGRYTDVGQEGSNVIPAYIRGKLAGVEEIDNAFDEARRILSDKAYETNKDYTTEEWKKLADKILKDRGFSGKEVRDEVVVFDPKNIRSRFAEFDPAASESAELSKATGGAVRKATGGLSRVNEAGNYTKPGMRKQLFNSIKARAVQGTKAGQWSARKAQLLAKKYKEQGGGYKD